MHRLPRLAHQVEPASRQYRVNEPPALRNTDLPDDLLQLRTTLTKSQSARCRIAILQRRSGLQISSRIISEPAKARAVSISKDTHLNQLIRLVYTSRSVVAPQALHLGLDPGIARILAKSRKNNARLDVVGGLLFGEGYFLQCLEGDAMIVQNLYNKIETDNRHRDVTVLSQTSINMRTFSAWSMKYVPGEQRLQGLLRQWGMTRFDPYQLSKDQIDAAVRFMRDESDAVNTVPSELHALLEEVETPTQQRTSAPQHDVTPQKPSHNQPAAAPKSQVFLRVLLGVALVCLGALALMLLG